MRSEETQFCTWTPDDDGNWETGCKQMHIFFTGTPRDNKYAFCPYCGQSLKQVDEIMDSTNMQLHNNNDSQQGKEVRGEMKIYVVCEEFFVDWSEPVAAYTSEEAAYEHQSRLKHPNGTCSAVVFEIELITTASKKEKEARGEEANR